MLLLFFFVTRMNIPIRMHFLGNIIAGKIQSTLGLAL